ncbi:MAG: ABC transporter ATP-binding protein [Bacteroidota bacterium]
MPSPSPVEPAQPMKRLFRYLDKYRGNLWFAISSSIVNKFLDLMPPFLTAWMIDTVSGNVPAWIGRWTGLNELWSIIIFLSILTIVIFGLESFFEWLFKRGFMQLAQEVQHDLRLDAYQKMQAREIGYFEEQRTGNLMAILNDDINQLERFLNDSFNAIIQMITLVLFAGWSLCIVSLELGLVGMLPIPFIILGSIYYQNKIAPHYREVRERVGELGSRLENNISGIQVIKSFTAEDFELQRVRQSSSDYRDANFKAIRWNALYVPLIRIFITIGFAATLLIGSYWVLNDLRGFTVGGLAFFAMMIQRMLWPITRLGYVFNEYERARASARRVFALLDTPNQIPNPEHPQTLTPVAGEVELQNVDFAYQSGQPILRNLSLHFRAGQMIGIAGPTGAGKTTLIKLLLRLYDVSAGRILIDGTDIRAVDKRELRRQIAMVSQEVYLFHGTIQENIAYGLSGCSKADIIDAAKKAQLHDFIDGLPQQYETIVGERGIKLSGGQRQRLSIARAILKDAPILILDEATSAVDTETERAIQQNLRQLTQGKTAIVIAHRLSTIRHADQIIVLRNGLVAESGTHEQLLDHEAIYADLWKVQIGALDSIY